MRHFLAYVFMGYKGPLAEAAAVVVTLLAAQLLAYGLYRLLTRRTRQATLQMLLSSGRVGPAATVTAKGVTTEVYSRLLLVPLLRVLLMAPRPGWTQKQVVDVMDAFAEHYQVPFAAAEETGLILRRLGYRLKLVPDRTLSPVSAKKIAKAFRKAGYDKHYGYLPLGLDQVGKSVALDVFGASLTVFAGSPRSGKSVLLYTTIAGCLRMQGCVVTVLDPSGVIPQEQFPGAKVLHALSDIESHFELLQHRQQRRQAMLKDAKVDSWLRLKRPPKAQVTICDESLLIFGSHLASAAKSATAEQQRFERLHRLVDSLISTQAKTGMALILSTVDPRLDAFGIRLAAGQKIVTYIAEPSAARAFCGDVEVGHDRSLRDGRFRIFGSVADAGWVTARSLHRGDLARRPTTPVEFCDELEEAEVREEKAARAANINPDATRGEGGKGDGRDDA